MHTEFWLEMLKERDNSENVGVDDRIILKWILGQYGERMWICLLHVSLERDRWRTFVNTKINGLVP
jgi:hypothetical protein